MSPPLPFRFVTSADSVERLPDTVAELAVVGRSNVGKSSLLNAVAGRTALAKTSKTPGRTQLLNCFALEPAGTLVDCPGYGYANTSKAMRAGWQDMIERYLLEREELAMILVLVDAAIGPTKLDLQMLEWLRANPLPHSVIATKLDKVKSSQRPRRRKELAAGCHLEPGDITWTSASKGIGIDELRDHTRLWLSPESFGGGVVGGEERFDGQLAAAATPRSSSPTDTAGAIAVITGEGSGAAVGWGLPPR